MRKDLMADAISKLNLKDIYLNESKLVRDRNFTFESSQDGIYQQELLTVEAEELVPDDETFPNLLRCFVTVGARFVRDLADSSDETTHNEDSVEELAKIEASFCVLYEKNDDIADECIKEFMKYNVVHNVWSFWRQHAFSAAREAKLPLPEVPLYKPKAKTENDKQK